MKSSITKRILFVLLALIACTSITLVLGVSSPKGLNLAVRGSDNKIWYNINDGSWNGWETVPGKTHDTPTIGLYDGDLHFVVSGLDGSIWHGILDLATDSWLGWIDIGGSTPSPPILTTTANSLILGVRGSDNKIYYRKWTGSWGEWKTVPGKTPTTPGITAVGDMLHIVVKGEDNKMYHSRVNLVTDSFSLWDVLAGSTPSAPTLMDDGEKVYLTARGSDNKIYYSIYTDSWSTWKSVLGKTETVVGASLYEGDLRLMVKGTDTKIYWSTLSLPSESFGGWSEVGGTTPNAGTLCSYEFDFRVDPTNPSQGEEITVDLVGDPLDSLTAQMDFSKQVAVVTDDYTWTLTGLNVPFTQDTVTITAESVDDLSVTATINTVPVLKFDTAIDGVASVDFTNIGSGNYDLLITGTAASGESNVQISIVTTGTLDVDTDGIYTINYDTSNIPTGDFTVSVEHLDRVITLLP